MWKQDPKLTSEIPCSACSWTPDRQSHCGYKSNIKLFYEAGDRGAWSLGSKYILKDRSNSAPNAESANIEFLRTRTSIPMPEIIADWEEDGRYFTIAKRIPGKPLSEAWETMSEDQRESVAKETAKFLLELREIHSDKIQMLGGKPVYDGFLFRSSHDAPHGPISSDAELWAELDKALTDVPLSAREKLRKRMPPAEPYTFTHGDLTHVNIMVEDGHVTGIIDWEGSGFFPVWWEFAKAGIGLSDTDAEWKALLRKYMPDHAEAREFWQDLCALSMYPDLNERGVEFLKGVEGQ